MRTIYLNWNKETRTINYLEKELEYPEELILDCLNDQETGKYMIGIMDKQIRFCAMINEQKRN